MESAFSTSNSTTKLVDNVDFDDEKSLMGIRMHFIQTAMGKN